MTHLGIVGALFPCTRGIPHLIIPHGTFILPVRLAGKTPSLKLLKPKFVTTIHHHRGVSIPPSMSTDKLSSNETLVSNNIVYELERVIRRELGIEVEN